MPTLSGTKNFVFRSHIRLPHTSYSSVAGVSAAASAGASSVAGVHSAAPPFSAIWLRTRARFVIGDCILPSNLESSSSLEGIFASSVNATASYFCPSTTPAFNSRAFASFANLARILAGAVASSLEIAIAFGPSRYSSN